MHAISLLTVLSMALAAGQDSAPAVPPKDPTPQVPASGPYELQRSLNRKERRARDARARKGR